MTNYIETIQTQGDCDEVKLTILVLDFFILSKFAFKITGVE